MAKDSGADRPEYMEVLGLSPPYAMEDVKKAYLDRVMQVHPDHGGSREDFTKLQEAFDLASKHLEIRVDRREWIAEQVDSYVVMQDVVDVLHRLGAEVTTNALDWLEQSFGEFAQLTETILAVRLEDCQSLQRYREERELNVAHEERAAYLCEHELQVYARKT